MSSNQSFLSSPKYGYDFVVATTQASINSTMKQYLGTILQPETLVCFLVDDQGLPNKAVTLEEFKILSGGIDPFSIPDGTAYNDPRITAVTQARFAVGLKIRAGLPTGIAPANLPNIVTLGNSANNVTFNLLCSEFDIVENNPPSGWGSTGSWTVLSQGANQSWYFKTTVNLIYADLDSELSTPYFNNHPAEKAALIAQLKNLGSQAFSIQQLLFDLDNAALQSLPTIAGLPQSSNAGIVLTKFFTNYYFGILKNNGEPLLSVHTIANTPDNSSLRLTGMERAVDVYLDANGIAINNPTADEINATTLCYLCAANNNPLPGLSSFNWNWVDVSELNNESGVISINRNTFANYYKNLLMPLVSKSCILTWVYVTCDHTWAPITGIVDYSWRLTSGQTPTTATINPTGDKVISISYASNANDSTKAGATYGELTLNSSYNCDVYFQNNQIKIVQHLVIYVYDAWDLNSCDFNAFDKTITDTYTISVGANGQLQISAPVSDLQDNSQDPNPSWIGKIFTDVTQIADKVKETCQNFAGTQFTDIPGADLQSFIFPGGQVFAFKDPQFSDNQDLVSKITYIKPS